MRSRKKIPDASRLVKKTKYDAKIGKVPSSTGLATTIALNAVEI